MTESDLIDLNHRIVVDSKSKYNVKDGKYPVRDFGSLIWKANCGANRPVGCQGEARSRT